MSQTSNIPKDDLDEVYKELVDKALGDISREEFSLLMYEFFGQLNNGHTRYRDPLIENCTAIGVAMDRIEGRFITVGGRAPSKVRGDAIVSINGRARVVGETTSGSTGQPVVQSFNSGISFSVGAIRTSLPDGSPFEGVGIEPDVHVPRTREDIYEDRDPVMPRAIEIAKELIA